MSAREVLMSTLPGRIADRVASSTVPLVSGPEGMCSDKMSTDAASSGNVSHNSMPRSVIAFSVDAERPGRRSDFDVHAESLGARGDAEPDAAEPDDAERRPLEATGSLAHALLVPVSRAKRDDALGDLAVDREHQAHRQLGDGCGVAAGNVGDDDASASGGVHVDGVRTGACTHHQLQRLAGRDGVGGHLGAADDQPLVVTDVVGHRVTRQVGVDRQRVPGGFKSGDGRGLEGVGNKDAHGHQRDRPRSWAANPDPRCGMPIPPGETAGTDRALLAGGGDPLLGPYPGAVTTAEASSSVTPSAGLTAAGRTYEVRTYGCQMNAHDSERLAGSLEAAGYRAAPDGEDADVVVFNTCAVRENADNRLYGNLGHLAPKKTANPDMQIAVGGCLAQKDRATIIDRAPWVDVVFGTHNVGALPVLLERARVQQEAQVEILESLEVFPSTLPTRRESAYAAWVSISVGCNNTCTFCIVPALRGVEKDRRPGDILGEMRALVDEGVLEVTLLGQNVNSYGVEFGDTLAFGKLLRACGEIDGLERVRFTSPHPRDFTDDVIAAMAETPNVMPQLHMPLQSGSDAVLKSMRRSYRREKYLGIIDRVRAAIPEAAITTDIIVGFPGETDADFEQTLEVVERARFAGAFTFQYSQRPGTPAATMENQVPADVVKERYQRLVTLVEDIAWDEAKTQLGRTVEVLIAEGEGRKDGATGRLSGRARDNRLVHFSLPEAAESDAAWRSRRRPASG